MGRKANAGEVLERARALLRNAKTAQEIRTAQAVLLPVEHGQSLEATARIVGRSKSWVARERTAFIKAGQILPKASWGGRRRQLLTEREEMEIVKAAVMLGRYGGNWAKRQRDYMRELLERRLGPVSDSTMDAMVRRVAQKFMPDGTAHDLRLLSSNLTEMWLRERVKLRKEQGVMMSP